MFQSSGIILDVICSASSMSWTQIMMLLDLCILCLSAPLTPVDVMLDGKLAEMTGVSTLLVG